jgi:glutaminase
LSTVSWRHQGWSDYGLAQLVSAGELSYERILDRVAGAVQSVLGSGRVPDQIPALASADPQTFGLAVATVGGEVHGVGAWRRRFSIQSISKVFTLALVIEKDGEALWTRVGRDGCSAVERFLRTECACPEVASDQLVASSEAEHGHRNAALAHFLASYGNLENPVGQVLDHYVRQERRGRRHPGEIVPGRCSLCVWSPGLDAKGNSVAGIAALDAFTTLTGWSVF